MFWSFNQSTPPINRLTERSNVWSNGNNCPFDRCLLAWPHLLSHRSNGAISVRMAVQSVFDRCARSILLKDRSIGPWGFLYELTFALFICALFTSYKEFESVWPFVEQQGLASLFRWPHIVIFCATRGIPSTEPRSLFHFSFIQPR